MLFIQQGVLVLPVKITENQLKLVSQFLKKLNIKLLYDPEIPLLGIYPRELKTYVHTKICTWMSVTELFKITKKWKQTKCLSTDDRINKL